MVEFKKCFSGLEKSLREPHNDMVNETIINTNIFCLHSGKMDGANLILLVVFLALAFSFLIVIICCETSEPSSDPEETPLKAKTPKEITAKDVSNFERVNAINYLFFNHSCIDIYLMAFLKKVLPFDQM